MRYLLQSSRWFQTWHDAVLAPPDVYVKGSRVIQGAIAACDSALEADPETVSALTLRALAKRTTKDHQVRHCCESWRVFGAEAEH